jgi:hypothetical protein
VVTVTGSAFPPNTTLYAHLAPLGGSGGTGNEYANYAVVPTNANGDYTMIFAMPAVWPNGVPIKTGRIAILIATADFSRQDSVTFDYVGVAAADEQPTPELPVDVPTTAPTAVPTAVPVEEPTLEPTLEPPLEPTLEPTAAPTDIPIELPTEAPTEAPVDVDTGEEGTIPPVLEPVLPVEPGT